jgi:toxin ParE1/3/4
MNDRETIFDYLEADSPRAAVLIDDRIEAQVELLVDTPRDWTSGPDRGNPRTRHTEDTLYRSLQY